MAPENGLYLSFKTNSDLMFNGGFSLTEINDMMPFERATYIQMWNEFAEERDKEENAQQGAY